ncbi:MAG TPA: POTRA domain-containing protein [Gemmatimonadales bacterium]|nr:POTRA domain-containing protein [Gemmatimonadales bacterium]
MVLTLPGRAGAQAANGSDETAGAEPPSPTIQAIDLQRRDIFDPEERSWYAKVANALHIQTRAHTIRRELLLHPGEPYDSALVAESERNLRALGVFRRVRIDSVRTDSGLVLRVLTKDGWSTKADWRFRSAGGDVEFTIGMVEDNLLGTASSAAVRYRKTTDRSTVALAFRQPRLVAGTVGFGAALEDRSDGTLVAAVIEQPFFSLASRHAFRLETETQSARVLRFYDGADEARDTLSRHYTLVRASGAWALRATTDGYLRLGVQAQVRRDDYRLEALEGDFARTVTGAVGPYLVWNHARFLVTHGVAGFAREEDVDLGVTVRAGAMVAPEAFGYDRTGFAPLVAARAGIKLPAGFGYVEALAGGLYTSAGLDSGSVQLAGTVVTKPSHGHVAVAHVEAGWIENPLPGAEFDLGLGTGPRAFGSHAFTGDRAVFATAEYRVTVAEDFLGLVGLGVAGFVDHGGAWYAGSPRRLGWDAGVGIRLGASRSSDTEALRFDLARRFANDAAEAGWVVTVGKGFAFSPIGKRGL